jgi:hypothetical protein
MLYGLVKKEPTIAWVSGGVAAGGLGVGLGGWSLAAC